MAKIQKNLRNFALGASILGLAVLGAATPAGSAPGYDGIWSVVIVTEKGACDRAYRYPIRIRNGAMLAEGSSPATINGKVASNGQVTVTVSAGSKSATGSGRLSGTAGSGSWTGGECSGTWEAERRGA
jgi:hypothetical protein